LVGTPVPTHKKAQKLKIKFCLFFGLKNSNVVSHQHNIIFGLKSKPNKKAPVLGACHFAVFTGQLVQALGYRQPLLFSVL